MIEKSSTLHNIASIKVEFLFFDGEKDKSAKHRSVKAHTEGNRNERKGKKKVLGKVFCCFFSWCFLPISFRFITKSSPGILTVMFVLRCKLYAFLTVP